MDKISGDEFKNKLDFLWLMANQISNLAYQNMKNNRMVRSLQLAKAELEGYKANLEILVEKRTAELKRLHGLLPICGHCKKVRDDKGYWNRIEAYIEQHSEATFSHGICKECAEKHYPDIDIYED